MCHNSRFSGMPKSPPTTLNKIMNANRTMFRTCAVLAATLLPAVAIFAAEATHRYFRFNPTLLREAPAAANSIQLSEFEFVHLSTALDVAGVTVTNPGGDSPAGEPPANIIDLNTSSKWLDFNKGPLVFDFGTPVTIDEYNFATANDAATRDPISWTFDGSDDGITWAVLDVIENYPTTTVRYTYEGGFSLPDATPPLITEFAAAPAIILNGTSTDLSWTTENGDSIVISPAVGSVSASGTAAASPPDDMDTTYTLSATNSTGSATAETLVRTVAGGTVSYQYFRFTPIKMRGAGTETGTQLAEFELLEGGVAVVPDVALNPGGNPLAGEGPEMVIDGDLNTKWLDPNKSALEFEFDTAVSIDGYRFSTANDFPDRDPVQWILEGSLDGFDWELIENFTAFDYPAPAIRFTSTDDIPLPGSSLTPYVQIQFYADQPTAIAGENVVLYWEVTGFYDTLEIDNGIGPVGDIGSEALMGPATSLTYTLTASLNGKPITAVLPITIINPAITDICYTDFESAGEELSLLGDAKIINDYLTILEPGDVKRLRLTEASESLNGTAWFRRRFDFSQGFDTTFDLHFISPSGNTGADGISFIIHDNPTGTTASPVPMNENGLPDNALNIKFDSYLNAGEPSAAFVEVREGSFVLATADLSNNPDITLGGTSATDLTQGVNDVPYRIRVTYIPGDLDVYFDGVLILENVNVDLASILALDVDGKGFVGFSARTGGAYESHDITSWCLTEGPPAAAVPIAILASSFDFESDTVGLTFTSDDTRTYRVTSSTDGIDFSEVLASGISGSAGATETSTSVNFTQAPFLLLRVEQE